jgi:hypothetical protein
MPHGNRLARNSTSWQLQNEYERTETRKQCRQYVGFTSYNHVTQRYSAQILNERLVHENQAQHGNGGPWTGCLRAPIDQNHQLSKITCRNSNIAHDYMGHQLSSHAFK